MSARDCFTAKIAAGRVSQRAGARLLDIIDETRADFARREGDTAASLRRADEQASEQILADAVRRADLVNRTIAAQSGVLDAVAAVNARLDGLKAEGKAPLDLQGETRSGTYAALSAFLDADPHELATYNSVAKLAKDIAGRAHSTMAETIGRLRSKMLGFKDEAVLELDMLRAAYGRTDVSVAARVDADAWFATEGPLAGRYIEAGGALAPRARYFPNPTIAPAKARALGEDAFKQLVRDTVDRAQVFDFATQKPMTEVRFEQLLNDDWTSIDAGGEGPISAFRAKTMLANGRDAPRLFAMRDADAWMNFAEAVGTHASPYVAMVEHINDMARDIALLERLGPNPDATLRFMADILDREPGRLAARTSDTTAGKVKDAVRANEKTASRAASEKRSLENLYANVAGTNRAPVSAEMARRFGDARSLLVGAQLGSAMISSLNDPATLLMTSRMAGLDVGNVLHWATVLLTEKGSEKFAAQTGMIMDTLALSARANDTVMGDTIRTGMAAKIGGAVIRASGLRKWTESLKGGFWLGAIAQVANDRATAFRDLDPAFRKALGRAGIGDAEWKIYAHAPVYEPRPNAQFLRPQDVASLGGKEAQAASEKLAQYVNTFMDYAVIEPTPRVRAMIVGDTKAGTISGELRRSIGMYRTFAGVLIYLHGARAIARGWDGSRMGHAALSFTAITLLGALSMQAKEVAAGRDPLPLNRWDAWGKAILQGGGLGVFGDILAVDQTRYGNSWASTFAGPVAGAAEAILGDFVLKNIRLASQGKETHFLGDGLYAAARYTPGSSLWYGRLAFQRGVIDQLALWADPRARERFARMEAAAQKDWGQRYWSRPGRAPERAPDFGAAFGR
jgi:hypothetical protein